MANVKKKTEQRATFKVKQVRSGAGRQKNQIQTLRGLGLRRINHEVEVVDNPCTRGMVETVKHLVEIVG